MKLHPDKNHAPQAADAFKKVSAAYACLIDKEKRKVYDMTGSDPGNNAQTPRSGGTRGRHDDDFSPEDIFNAFFGGDIFGPSMQQRRAQQRYYQQQQANRQHRDDMENPFQVLFR